MLGRLFSNHERHTKASDNAYRRAKKSNRSFRFEALDDRHVMSALPIASGFDLESETEQPASQQASLDPQVSPQVDIPLAVFNSAPQGTDKTVLMTGLTYTFIPQDFGFSDPGNDPPDLFLAVRITTLPQRGSITLNGSGVAAGQFISVADILGGDLKFTNVGTEAFAYATFTFQVQDDGGTPDGGSDLDPSPNTFTLIFDSNKTNFIYGLYNDLLQREPERNGLIAWLNQLGNGVSNQDVANGLWRTPEHRALQVDAFYQRFFFRTPEPVGRQFWTVQLVSGTSEEQVMGQLLATPEYSFLHTSNEQFVDALYADLLNRPAETGGRNQWVSRLANGTMTRAQVANALIDTPERHQLIVRSYYETFFHRQPDSSGNAFWVTMLNQDLLNQGQVAERLLGTPEYFNIDHF